ncbi:MAG: phage integrase SAM-like domain-containing protein, partial [Parolsenella sp.]|uniref:tyrosine-type recombinase/integrase n=1 Tax=Parolsenella sp. TaxID=2083006 RepID=UPI002E7738DC
MRKISKGSIEKRAKGKFRLKVTIIHDDGATERVAKSIECRTKTEAGEELDRWRREMRTSGEAAVTDDITLKAFLLSHITYLRDVKGLSPNTLRGYRDIVVNRWSPNIGSVRLRDVTPYTIERQLAWLKREGGRNGRPVSGTTCQKAFSFLKTALKHAVRLGYISSNPCDMLDAPTKNKTEVTVLDEAEVARMKELV